MLPLIYLTLALACIHLGRATPVSEAEKQEILNSHNEWRKNAGATAMLRLKWNDELARYAEQAVSRCKFDHTTWNERQGIAGFSYIGENIYVNTAKPTFKEAIDSWGDEEKDYDLATDQCSAVCTHYTQITWAKTSDVGCAIAQCSNVIEEFGHPGYLLFCNYGVGGNMKGEKPFEKGAPGSKCQTEFKSAAGADGLCGEGDSATVPEDKPTEGDDQESNEPNKEDEEGTDDNQDEQGDQDSGNNDDGDNGDNSTDNGSDTGDQGNNAGQGNGECSDELTYCADWTRHCGREWTKVACRKTCNFCGNNDDQNNNGDEDQDTQECKDDIWFCNDWLDSCNEDWAKNSCRKSCNHC